MHYTIDKNHKTIEVHETDKPVVKWCYIPGHSIGGATRHIVELAEGDTADNPASTKDVLHGPSLVVYDRYEDGGVNTVVFESAKDFYKQFKIDVPWEDIQQLIDYNWVDEARDYETSEREGNDTEGHIYETLLRLAFWMAGSRKA